eukprot:4827694-Alexandrium_andersonii.AAC.1
MRRLQRADGAATVAAQPPRMRRRASPRLSYLGRQLRGAGHQGCRLLCPGGRRGPIRSVRTLGDGPRHPPEGGGG